MPPSVESGGNRTHNLWIKSPLLCQLSYAPARLAARGSARITARAAMSQRLRSAEPRTAALIGLLAPAADLDFL